jgi:hypothetical protein
MGRESTAIVCSSSKGKGYRKLRGLRNAPGARCRARGALLGDTHHLADAVIEGADVIVADDA